MDVKAIMCDVDGTLLNSQGIVSPMTVEMIKKQEKRGFYLVYLQVEMYIASKLF